MLAIAESTARTPQEEAAELGKALADNWFDDEVNGGLVELMVSLVLEQPFKVPFVAAIALYANDLKPDVTMEILSRIAKRAQEVLEAGSWRSFKLLLRFLACLQGLFEGEGVFGVMDELFNRAVDLQTASQDDVGCLTTRCGELVLIGNHRLSDLNSSRSSSLPSLMPLLRRLPDWRPEYKSC
ncbi:hypothetical protein LTS18_002454 [Coniosporium uncinatum]|uniref:Uncharacterized protein n=1 Tax=Coniosporium uncinatum TaxID=93489 RepID=A0ACC3DDS3_9PEZI|nr:hypothetical protein LTS18_002454 [Coniosporium uncinatum]